MTKDSTTRYSQKWFEAFLESIPETQTATEVAFLVRQLPIAKFSNILDLCCGSGRHALRLAQLGYRVTGVDQDAAAILRAQAKVERGARFVRGDIRDLSNYGTNDAVLILWSSFGQFSDDENMALFQSIARHIRPGGRLVLDIYHREFFEAHQGVRTFERQSVVVTETKRVNGNRLTVKLSYSDSPETDSFNWQVFRPDELAALAARAKFELVLACSEFDEQTAASMDRPRMQLVFERRGRER
jgi:SAM-dependent methyltransferase